jgi:hypothetical protein
VDGRKSQVFAGLYRLQSAVSGPVGGLQRVVPDALFETGQLLDRLEEEVGVLSQPSQPIVVVVGDGAEPLLRRWSLGRGPSATEGGWDIARGPKQWDVPRARILGRLVAARADDTSFDEEAVHRLEPDYLRLSDAEIRWDSR